MMRHVFTAVLASLTWSLGADVELVKDGVPVSEIVVSKDAIQGVKLAAEDLRKHLKMISGADVPIVNSPNPEAANKIFVGESEFTKELGFAPAKFNNSAYEILVKDNYVILNGPDKQRKEASPYGQTREDAQYLKGSVITGKVFPKPKDFPSPGLKAWQDFCGEKFTAGKIGNVGGSFNEPLGIRVNDDLGTWYAVAAFLEDLGVRWYMPYEHGAVIPEMKTISIPERHVKKEAKFGRREWCYYRTMTKDAEGIKWLKRLKCGNYNVIIFNHTTYDIYSSYEQQRLHPEYLARDSAGKWYEGYPKGRGIPRYTNPAFRQAAVTWMNKVFDAFPELSAISVGRPDGSIRVDARDIELFGKPEESLEQKASNYVWDFNAFLAEELKKSHPGKKLIYMTGAGAWNVPTNMEKFPDNMIIPFHPTVSHLLVLDANWEALISERREWLEKMRECGMREINKAPRWRNCLYYGKPSKPRYPVVFTKSLQREMREILPYTDGKFIEVPPEKHTDENGTTRRRLGMIGLSHLMMYWQNKLFWDPDIDRQQTLDEYYALFFGPASAEMKEFYEFAEDVWSRQESREITETTGFLKEKDVDKYFEILGKAREKAGKGTIYDKRVAMIEDEMRPLKKLFPNLKRTGPSFRVYPTSADFKIDGDLDEYKHGWSFMRDLKTGRKPKENLTRVAFAMPRRGAVLLIAVECGESAMNQLKADCDSNDDSTIFNDDSVEIYINTPERSYFKIAVNPNGAVWDETTDAAVVKTAGSPVLWNPGTKVAIKKHPDRWTAEIMIPTKDLGKLGPSKAYPWGIQVGRTRFAGGTMENWALAPTGGSFDKSNRWGNLVTPK